MATLNLNGSGWLYLTPSSTIRNVPTTSGTFVALVKSGSAAANMDVFGLVQHTSSSGTATTFAWFHTIGIGNNATQTITDDDGVVFLNTSLAQSATTDWWLIGLDFNATTASVERAHSRNITLNSSTAHANSASNNGGSHSGYTTGTDKFIRLGYLEDQAGGGNNLAIAAIWQGKRLTDAQFNECWANKRTSDLFNNSAGQPDLLIETTSTSPTDIGANPSTFGGNNGLTATGPNPTGWTFDGTGGPPPAPPADTTLYPQGTFMRGTPASLGSP